MKTNLLRSMMTVLLIMMVVGNGVAQSIVEYAPKIKGKDEFSLEYKPNRDLKEYEVKEVGDFKVYQKKKTFMPSTRAEAPTYTVTCRFEYDEELFKQPSIYIYNKDFEENGRPEKGSNEIQFSLPVGTYDLYGNYWLTEDGKKQYYGCSMAEIIKENISVNRDTVILLEASLAKNHIHIEKYLPSGELCDQGTTEYKLEPTGEVSYTITGNNIIGEGYDRSIIKKGFGAVAKCVGQTGGIIIYPDGTKIDSRNNFDFLISDLSDNYLWTEGYHATGLGGEYYIINFQKSGVTGNEVIKNDPQNYLLKEEYFQPTVLGKQAEEHHSGINTSFLYKRVQVGGMEGTFSIDLGKDAPVKLYIDPFTSEQNEEERVDMMVMAQYGDHMYEIEEDWGDEIVTTPMTAFTLGSWFMIHEDKEIEYINKGHDAYGNFSFQKDPDEEDIYELPGHPVFSFLPADRKIIYGNSCPINAVMAQNYFEEDAGGKLSFIDCCYIGRFSEIRMSDYQALETSIKYNGTEVCNDYSKLNEWAWNWTNEHHPDGELQAKFINNNVEVDGIPGKNVTVVKYDQRKEDWTAPTLQMLHFRNIDQNLITDRFDKAEDGVLEFAGGDFNFKTPEDKSYFDCQPMTIQVLYAPYGTETWKELPIKEIPEYYRYPAFGYFYRGELSAVTENSANNWYDMKLILTDQSGNMQSQLISPAFRIESVTGITSQQDDTYKVYATDGYLYINNTENLSVSIYDIAGQCMGRYEKDERPIPVCGLSSGIYFIEMARGTEVTLEKVLIK